MEDQKIKQERERTPVLKFHHTVQHAQRVLTIPAQNKISTTQHCN